MICVKFLGIGRLLYESEVINDLWILKLVLHKGKDPGGVIFARLDKDGNEFILAALERSFHLVFFFLFLLLENILFFFEIALICSHVGELGIPVDTRTVKSVEQFVKSRILEYLDGDIISLIWQERVLE